MYKNIEIEYNILVSTCNKIFTKYQKLEELIERIKAGQKIKIMSILR